MSKDQRPALTTDEWHNWFSVQAGWTQATRNWLYEQAGLTKGQRVLEVGCGTGVIASDLIHRDAREVWGLDIDAQMLAGARSREKSLTLVQGDAHSLPFPDNCFDIVVCHYLLLWLEDPARAVGEMARVVRPAGSVLACAEPDYGGRIDHPPDLVELGRLQAQSLRIQGADPETGRRLGELFSAAGLGTTVGVMAGTWDVPHSPDEGFEAEWEMREQDLAGLIERDDLSKLRSADRQALKEGRRTLFVPTFYAIGRRVT
jgi:SAM-dependent methyltransferase